MEPLLEFLSQAVVSNGNDGHICVLTVTGQISSSPKYRQIPDTLQAWRRIIHKAHQFVFSGGQHGLSN